MPPTHPGARVHTWYSEIRGGDYGNEAAVAYPQQRATVHPLVSLPDRPALDTA